MEAALATITTAEAAVGWVLVGLGVLAIILAVAVSAVEAARKAFGTTVAAEGATSVTAPWDKVIDAITAILKELMGKTGGPTFFMGLILVAAGVLVLNDKL